MTILKVLPAALALTLALAGCAGLDYKTGTEISKQQMDSLVPGKSTQKDVIRIVGQTADKRDRSGKEIWTYHFTKIGAMPWSPNVSESAVFEFDKKGVLLEAYKDGAGNAAPANPLIQAAEGK